MRRRYVEYRPPKRWRLGHYGLFRSAQLNAVGWAAVAALCLAGAAIGYGVGLLIGWLVAVWPVIGGLLSLLALVVMDRRKWGRVWSGYSWGDSPEATESVGIELRRLGLPVETAMYPDGRIHLRYRHRDGARVALALSHLGVPPPRGW